MKVKKPNLFLVGAPRCGTTSLYEYLKQHPEVFMSEVKGPNFFGEEPNINFPQFFRNKKKYLSLFSNVRNEKIIGEASHYFSSKTAPKEIRKFNPKAKIIIIIRNPIDVVYSYYNVGIIPNNEKLSIVLKKNISSVKWMFENLKYYENIKRYIAIFGRENVYVIIFEEFMNNPIDGYKSLCKFLKINYKFRPNFKRYNPSKEIKNKFIVIFIRNLPPGIRLLIKNLLPSKILNKLKNKIEYLTTKNIKKIHKDKDVVNSLKKHFELEVEKTSKLIGRDLKKIWNF